MSLAITLAPEYIYKGRYNWEKARKALEKGISKKFIRENNMCLEVRAQPVKWSFIYRDDEIDYED